MIKSRNASPASCIIVFGLGLFLFTTVISLYSIFFNSNILNDDLKKGANPIQLNLCIGVVGFAVLLFIASVNLTLFAIDKDNEKIIVKNFISRRTHEYFFDELDGYCDMTTKHVGKTLSPYYRAIGLVKDKKIKITIDSYYCSNLAEMRNGLSKIKYLGTDESWKLLKR